MLSITSTVKSDLYRVGYIDLKTLKPSDIPEQRPMYMESLSETRGEFMNKIQGVMDRIAVDTFNSEIKLDSYLQEAEEHVNAFFNSMKGAVNLSPLDAEELVREEVERQKRFYTSINELVRKMPDGRVISPDKIFEYPYWDHAPSRGCNIRSRATTLYAFPRLPASTVHYLTLKQGPIPANIIHVSQDYILMLPYAQDLSEDLRELFIGLVGTVGKVRDERLEDELRVKKNFLSVITEQKVYQHILDELLKDYGAQVIQVGHQSTNVSYIHTGMEEDLPRLWRTIYFDWAENWRRHQ